MAVGRLAGGHARGPDAVAHLLLGALEEGGLQEAALSPSGELVWRSRRRPEEEGVQKAALCPLWELVWCSKRPANVSDSGSLVRDPLEFSAA
jgi:hypothetical protein